MRYRPILTVALLLAPLAARATDSLPGTDAKVQTATKVFDDLVSAIGDGRSPPAFRIVPRGAAGGMQVAWFDPTARSVSIQEETFDLCASLGIHENDALAVLLGHELVHYY